MERAQNTVTLLRLAPSANFPFACVTVTHQTDSPPHDHDCYELVFVVKGSGTHVIHERPYPILAGDIYLMRAGEVHIYTKTRELSIYNMLFRESLFTESEWNQLTTLPGIAPFLIAPMDKQRHKLSLAPPHDRDLSQRCERIHRTIHEQARGWQLGAKALFIDLLLTLDRLALAYKGPPELAEGPAPGAVAATVAYIHANYPSPIRMADLANEAGLTANYLGELFQQEIGMSMQAYVNRLRVDKSRDLLEHSDRSATEIALDVGFDTLSYFGKVFRQATGHTPREYRRLVRK